MEPNTSLKLTQSGRSGHRVSLERGKLHAVIWARPKLFFVDTPSAVTVDLGCAYSLEVDNEGNTVVHVTHGLVSIESRGRDSYILAGAVCVARKDLGPGTPYYGDASPALIQALDDFDVNARTEALATVLAEARKKDVLTLWHLIPKTTGTQRAAIIDRMAAFVPLPPGVTRDGVLNGEQRDAGPLVERDSRPTRSTFSTFPIRILARSRFSDNHPRLLVGSLAPFAVGRSRSSIFAKFSPHAPAVNTLSTPNVYKS